MFISFRLIHRMIFWMTIATVRRSKWRQKARSMQQPVIIQAPPHTLDLLPPVDPEEFVETVVDTEKDPTSSMHPNPAMLPDKYTDTLEKDIKSDTHLDDDDEAL